MIVYASRTGNVRYIVSQLGLPSVEITNDLTIHEPYFLITYTDKLGETPELVWWFLKNNYRFCKGVIASGNSNFGINNFCGTADEINKKYNIQIIHKIELRGFKNDYELIIDKYNNIVKGG